MEPVNIDILQKQIKQLKRGIVYFYGRVGVLQNVIEELLNDKDAQETMTQRRIFGELTDLGIDFSDVDGGELI